MIHLILSWFNLFGKTTWFTAYISKWKPFKSKQQLILSHRKGTLDLHSSSLKQPTQSSENNFTHSNRSVLSSAFSTATWKSIHINHVWFHKYVYSFVEVWALADRPETQCARWFHYSSAKWRKYILCKCNRSRLRKVIIRKIDFNLMVQTDWVQALHEKRRR